MTLSIIIVNYNVKYFLEQCLCSVRKAIKNIDAEIFVVDNNSSDGSVDYLKPKFHFVEFIINKENVGFSKANNQALALAKGKYILFLNPDTIVAEDSFEICISFLEKNSDAGALGVKMIDGSGNYLKESKRGFPSPWASFCKLSGLTALFPLSKIFAKYYLGNLSEDKNQITDSISGAFFFSRKDVLYKTGGFDEQFFMYAEDIDLSYRIQLAGYKNYYLSETTIIHFKGESTTKDFKYVNHFYKAMKLFSKKYFRKKSQSLLRVLIGIGIWIRKKISFFHNRFYKSIRTKPTQNQNVFFIGDEASIEETKKQLILSGKKIVLDRAIADELVFCEGKHFSFLQIINGFKQNVSKKLLIIHAEKSNCLVGSFSKNNCGVFFALNP